jgi:RNA polymerase sigma factor (sigma-70 family)
MDVREDKEHVYSLLKQLANQKGYITFDDILKSADSASIPIDEVDRLCELIISEGIIICDNDDIKVDSNAPEVPRYDKSQLNYTVIYKRVLTIDKTLFWYVEKLKLIEPPQKGEEALLVQHVKEGNQFANDRLISMFLKVALRIALWHHDKFGYPLDETIQDANVGLILALKKIPQEMNVRFSTYAHWWILQYITRQTQGLSGVFYNLPAHIKEKLKLVIKIKRNHDCPQCIKLGHCSNLVKDICRQLSVDSETALYYLDLIQDRFSLEQVEEDRCYKTYNPSLLDRVVNKARFVKHSDLFDNYSSLIVDMQNVLTDEEWKAFKLLYLDDLPELEVNMILGKRVDRTRNRILEKVRKLLLDNANV